MRRLFLVVMILVFAFPGEAKTLNGFDVSNALVSVKDIVQGGPPRDGIPAILDPDYVEASQASFLNDDDIVLGFECGGRQFAYPRHILNWHELVNGQVDGKAFLISYCPLCGTGMAFSSLVDGEKLVFGVSGLLYNSDVLFYDKKTESLWSQIEKKAVSGKHAGTGLSQLYLEIMPWSLWVKQHPETLVLSENQGIKRNYRHDPYSGYESTSRLFFQTLREAPKEFHTKERVLGVDLGKASKAYPFVELRKAGKASFDDQINGRQYRVLWDAEHEIASLEKPDGEKVTTTVAYWFAWYAFYPETEVFRAPE